MSDYAIFKSNLENIVAYVFIDDDFDFYYHYTKTENVQKIFNSNQIFVSNKNCMNDKHEVDYPKKLLLSELNSYGQKQKDGFIEYLYSHWKNDALYSFSVTSNDNNTYLLNNYGKSIIRIETKSIKIATVKDYGRPSWRFGKVIYNLAKQKKIIHKFLKLYFDIEEKQNEDISDDDYEQLELMQYELINHLCVALDLFKEESKYSKEEETRFVFDFEGRTDNTIHENNGKKYIILENIASFAQFHKTIT